MDGDYECDDLGALLAVATANANQIEESRGLMGAFNWLGDRLLVSGAQCVWVNGELGDALRPGARCLAPPRSRPQRPPCSALPRLLLRQTLAHRARSNTLEGSRRNIEEHYDAGGCLLGA